MQPEAKREHGGEPGHRAAGGLLARSHPAFLALLWILVLGLAGTAAVAAWGVCRAALGARSTERAAIQLPAARDEPTASQGLRAPVLAEEPDDALSASATAGEAVTPEFDWREAARLRKAAALLVRHNEYEAAIHLLDRGNTSDGALHLGVTVHRQAQAALDCVVAAELGLMRTFWDGLSDEQRQAYFAPGEPAVRKAFEQTLATGGAGASPETLGTYVPESLLFCFVANAQAAMKEQGNCPEELIRLLLESLFAPGSPARRLWSTMAPVARLDYAENQKLFDRQFNAGLLTPLVRGLLGAMKGQYEAAVPEVRAWYDDALGAAFCQGLLRAPLPEADELQLRLLWLELPVRVRALWGRELRRAVMDRDNITLPPFTLAENYWLKEGGAPLDAELLRVVCSHPEWLRALRQFAYDDALRALPAILRQLGVESEQQVFVRVLTRGVQREWELLTGPSVDWSQLGAHLKVEEKRPPALRGARRRPPVPVAAPGSTQTWSDVSMEAFHGGLRFLAAATASPSKQAYYQRLARLYASNRGMEE